MKAFLLAAGNGTRLRPLTETIPKCLVPICGTPLLGIWLALCRRHGINEVLINVHAQAGAVRDYIASDHFGLRITLFEEPTLLGSAGTLAANRDWVEGESFWIFYADVLTNVDLGPVMALHRSKKLGATLAVYRVDEPSRCGIVALDGNGLVTQFVEKPAHAPGNLAFSGVLIGTSQFLDAIPDTRPSDIGFHVLPRLAGNMSACESEAYFLDIGSPHNYQKAQETWPGL